MIGHPCSAQELSAAESLYSEARDLYDTVGVALGVANCVYCLADVSLARADQGDGESALHLGQAEAAYRELRTHYRQVSDVLGEANCIYSLGENARRRQRNDEAKGFYLQALAQYEGIPERISIGHANHRLAQVTAGRERALFIEAARRPGLRLNSRSFWTSWMSWRESKLRSVCRHIDKKETPPNWIRRRFRPGDLCPRARV